MSFDLIQLAEESHITELEQRVVQARHDYYNGQPSVSDDVYDSWVDELADLKDGSNAVISVGAPPVSAWGKVHHSIPMGSLGKVQTLDEMTAWVGKNTSEDNPESELLLVTEKLDGISVSLTYVSGKLTQALTRGDGSLGEDITVNVSKMQGASFRLPKSFSAIVRGEIILLKEDLREYFSEFSNSRNAASGIAKRLDGKGSEHLSVLVYQVFELEQEFKYESDTLEFLKSLGFTVPNWYKSAMKLGVKTPQDIWVDYQQSVRDSLPYDIDGLVVRLDNLEYQLSLGEKNNCPVGAVAFKFSPITRETKALRRVDQVGGTGKITPVAEFAPVNILGTTITRASLYNQKYIEQIGFDVGCRILVSRSNDVIPRVVSAANSGGTVSQPPEFCPVCGVRTEREGEYVVCPNTGGCPAQAEGRLRQWCKELGILEWGPGLVSKVIEAGLAKSVPDLYRIKVDQLASLDRMGEVSAKKALDQLWEVVSVPMSLDQLLGALCIPLCSTATIQLVVEAGFDTLDKIKQASVGDLQSIAGMGPKRASSLRSWLDHHSNVLDELVDLGVTIEEKIKGYLTGKSVCFTGKSKLKRAELIKLVEANGGTVKKSVCKGLTYLVSGGGDSNKTLAAKKNGIKCITEEEFMLVVLQMAPF